MTALTRARNHARTTLMSLPVRLDIRLRAPRGERGDVPGWVLITLMTAAIVAALWTLAETQLTGLFQDAMDSVRDR